MKKILHMTPPIVNNGVYQYVFNHMKYLNRDNYQFDFLTRNATDLMTTEAYKKYHFQIQSFQNTEREGKDGLRKEVVRILSQGYDAIHLHTSFWRGFLIEEIAMEMQLPQVIVHSHSSGIDVENEEERNKLLLIHEDYKKQFNKRYATDFCACSQLAGEWLFGEQIPQKEIKILKNAIELEPFLYAPDIRQVLRKKLGVEDKIVIGNVGRFCYQKNHQFLIRAFAKAHERNRKLFLLLIGEGELEGEIQLLIEQYQLQDCVKCIGWQKDIGNILQMMDVFCLPSRFEGFPLLLIEAQAAGIRCYASDTITEESKITNLLNFLSLDLELWALAMAESRLDNDRVNMWDEMTKQGFNIQEEIKNLEKLYD